MTDGVRLVNNKIKNNGKFSYLLLSYVIIPSLVVLIASFGLGLIWNQLGFEGVTKNFFDAVVRRFPISIAILWVLYFIFRSIEKEKTFDLPSSQEKYQWYKTAFILIPLTTIIQYIFSNQGILELPDIIIMLGFGALFSSVFIVAIPLLLWKTGTGNQLISLGTAFTWLIFQMASFSARFNWYQKGNAYLQTGILLAACILIFVLINLKENGLVLFILVGYFIASSGLFFYKSQTSKKPLDQSPNREILNETTPAKTTPDIFLLIYDSYVGNETMLGYGLDNSHQEQLLRDLGFTLYPSVYSVGAASLQTMQAVLDLSLVHENTSRKGVSGDGIVQQKLTSMGYVNHGVFESDYMFKGTQSSYDYSLPVRSKFQGIVLIQAILLGEFRFDIGYDEQTHADFLEVKRSVLSNEGESPRFLYAHSVYPNHSQNSGICLENETELYAERLERANTDMLEDVRLAIANNSDAIIIVAGDHGPYLTKNCYATILKHEMSEIDRLDIQDRYGSFLAIRWPEDRPDESGDIKILQDIFPSIFAYLYDDRTYLDFRVDSTTLYTYAISGAYVKDGIIYGGLDDGEPLFLQSE